MIRTRAEHARRMRTRTAGAIGGALGLVLAGTVITEPASAVTYVARINFEPAAQAPIAGFTADTGQPFDATRGYGWEATSSSAPLDMSGNTRWKPAGQSDPRLSGMVQMQQLAVSAGTPAPGKWEYVVPNGTYAVTVSAGDGGQSSPGIYCCLNSTDRLTVEGVLAIADYAPTATAPFMQATVTVAVSDGRITIDPTGGVNTKINYVDIATSTDPPQAPTPEITSVAPLPDATQVSLNTSVSLGVSMPIDPASLSATTFALSTGGVQVAGNYNTDAAGGTASFTPAKNLTPNTKYTVTVTAGLKASNGAAFYPFTSAFTTGTSPPPLAPYGFSVVSTKPIVLPNVLVLGPDGYLYVGAATGQITRFPRNADGSLGAPETTQPFGSRIITGLAFDPQTPTKLWVTNNFNAYDNAPRYSGHVSVLNIPPGQPLSSATASDVIVGLPRSAHDHMTNGIAFGPDGKLYIAQGANTAYGSPDGYWGTRGEQRLSAAVLVADVDNTAVFVPGSPIDVNTDPVGTTEDSGSDAAAGYDPTVAGAPVTIYAYGVRNAFTLLWRNGLLYAPVNESAAGGTTPAGPANVPPSVSNVQAYDDYFTRIDAGRYYGHPNPAQGFYALNGGNPTANGDPWEVTEYPIGTQPDPTWRAPDFSMGQHRSPDGAVLYTNTSQFNGALAGKILVSEYSNGDDLVAVTLDSNGKAVSEQAIPDANNPGQALIFSNPLGVATDPATGVVYVAEQQSGTATSGQVTTLTPGASAVHAGVHVNFQPASSTAPSGYTADSGAAFNGTQGWTDASGAPLNLTANTRARGSSLSPDSRYDTMVLMQAPAGSGNATPGRWTTTLTNGTYNVTVAVGDPTATNSVDEITALLGSGGSVPIIDHFQPTTGSYWSTMTKRLTVTDGKLTLDPTGGTNTKIDFVDIDPAGADPGDPPPPTSGHVDFGTQASAPYSGYVADYGQGYDASRGYGWEDTSNGNAASLVGNGRQRNSGASPDSRYDAFLQLQQTSTGSGGVLTVGRWEYALANGTYNVTVAVGDPTAVNSVDTVMAERGTANQTAIVNGYVPTAAAPFQTVTKRVTVTDGRLTLDPTGGTNTKLDFVDIEPAGADPGDPPPPTSGHVDFGTQTSAPFSGYVLDYGQSFDAACGFGWEDNSTGSPASLVGNGRQRNSSASPDSRYDAFLQLQQTTTGSGGVLTVGRWEYALANGTYNVTVGVGDPTALNSAYTITAERGTANQTTIINGYVPTAGTPFQTVTKQVTVTDGRLTLDPTGGTNTKIDFVDITPIS